MTQEDITFVKWCIINDMHRFYTWSKWLKVRREVLEQDKNECQDCKEKGIYTRATTVHHNMYVKNNPELALEKYYVINGHKKRNLISLCFNCHEERHGYRKKNYHKPLTEERW